MDILLTALAAGFVKIYTAAKVNFYVFRILIESGKSRTTALVLGSAAGFLILIIAGCISNYMGWYY